MRQNRQNNLFTVPYKGENLLLGGELITPKVVDPNLVLWLPANTASNWLQDFSGNGNNGTAYGDASYTNAYGGVIDLDGDGDYVGLGTAANFGVDVSENDYTFSAWFKTDSTQTYSPIFTVGGECLLSVINGEKMRFNNAISDLRAYADTFSLSTWHHVAVSWDATTPSNSKIYIDGASIAYTENSSSVEGSDVSIGYFPGVAYFNGLLDDTRIYSRVLTATEILAMYNNTSGTYA